MVTRTDFQALASNLINNTFADFRDPLTFELVGAASYEDQNNPVLETNNTNGIRIEFSKSQIDGQSVQIGDYMILVERQSVNIDVRADNVLATFNGKAVAIINVDEDAARAAYTIQVRDK